MSGLRDLDDRVVPRLAVRLRATLDAGRSWRAGAPAQGFLRRLDDRYARRGPLAVVRDVPQIGLAVVAAVFLAGAGVALARGGDGAGRVVQTAQADAVLGPEVGTVVSDYVERVRDRSVALSAQTPDDVHVALVSLRRYHRPEEVGSLLEGLEVERAYLKVPSSDPSEVLTADVQDLVADLRGLYATTAQRRAEDREEFITLSRGMTPTSPEETSVRDQYELSARLAGREAQAYRTGCPCVFAAVVEGPAAVLAALPALDGVRAVELAPTGTELTDLRVRPLPPEQTATVEAGAVTRPGRPGG